MGCGGDFDFRGWDLLYGFTFLPVSLLGPSEALVEKSCQSCCLAFDIIDAVVEYVVWFVDDLVLLFRKIERAVTLDLGTVGYLWQDCAQLGKVIEEALLLVNLILATPLLVELIGQEVEIWKFITAVLLGDHGAHFYKGGGGIYAGLLQLNGDDDGISLEDKRKQALERKAARSVNNEVEVLGTHGSDKVTGVPFAVELGTGNDLVQGLEQRPSFKVLLLLLDDAAGWRTR